LYVDDDSTQFSQGFSNLSLFVERFRPLHFVDVGPTSHCRAWWSHHDHQGLVFVDVVKKVFDMDWIRQISSCHQVKVAPCSRLAANTNL
jgi:hypothetical protein